MRQAKSNNQNFYGKITVIDVRIRNLEPGHGKFEKRILILALTLFHPGFFVPCSTGGGPFRPGIS